MMILVILLEPMYREKKIVILVEYNRKIIIEKNQKQNQPKIDTISIQHHHTHTNIHSMSLYLNLIRHNFGQHKKNIN